MNKALYTLLSLFCVFTYSSAQHHLSEVGFGYAGTSVNATIFRHSSIVTHCNKQYIAYYDSIGRVILGSRNLNTDNWLICETNYVGNVKDAHNSISIGVDGAGYLHVAFDHHGHSLNYCRSVTPHSLKLGEKRYMTQVDEENVTYPEFYNLDGGDLLFVYRSGSSGRGNLVMKRYDVKTQCWYDIQEVLISGEDKRNAYWQLDVDGQGVIHLSWVWRETWMVETNHDLCYARSDDKGKTWRKTNGDIYQLPITASSAEYACVIPQNSELINQTSMVADSHGNPYIATYWRSPDSDVPQYRLVWHDGTQWNHRQVGERVTPFSLKGGGTKRIPIARPCLVIHGDEAYLIFRDEERGSRVSMAYVNNIKHGNWDITDLTDFSVDAWEPSYDKVLWRNHRLLHLYIQQTAQGDGEKVVDTTSKPVYVLEVDIDK